MTDFADSAIVSIIIPCFNDGKYIGESVESALKQTYSKVEIIIVDDGSDDENTITILKSFMKQDNIRVKLSRHAGPSVARNIGIGMANGRYILPLDSDDKIESTYVEKAVMEIEKDNDVGIVYCQADYFGKKKGRWDLPAYSLKQMLLSNIIFATALFRRDDWEKVGGYSEEMVAGIEDYDFWLSILELGRRVIQIPEILFHYRIKKISRTTLFNNDFEQRRKMERHIWIKHKKLYLRYFDDYNDAIREKLLEKEFKLEIVKKYSLYSVMKWMFFFCPSLKYYIKKYIGSNFKE